MNRKRGAICEELKTRHPKSIEDFLEQPWRSLYEGILTVIQSGIMAWSRASTYVTIKTLFDCASVNTLVASMPSPAKPFSNVAHVSSDRVKQNGDQEEHRGGNC